MRALPQLAEREDAELREELLLLPLLSEELTELREELPLMRLLLCEAAMETEKAELNPGPPEVAELTPGPPEAAELCPVSEAWAELLLLGQAEQSRHRPSCCSCPL